MNKEGGLSHKLHGLDHLRTLAILLVFLFHYGRLFPHPEWTNRISNFGWTGVDLFFVLSGYLIASQLFKKIADQQKISLKEFFIKRFFRILPAYLIVVALYFLFPVLREGNGLAPLWKYLTFTQNIGLDLRTQSTFSHAWSLCIEEQFYLLLPLALITLLYFNQFKKAFWILIALFAFGFVMRLYSYHYFVEPFLNNDDAGIYWLKWIYYPTWCRLDGLLVGISIAALLQFKPNFKQWVLSYGNALFVCSLFILTAAYFLCLDQQSFGASVFGFPLVSIGYGVLVLSAVSANCFLYKFKSNITAKIAALSYGIYLIHKIVIHVTQNQFIKYKIDDGSNTMFLICVAAVFIASVLLNEIIEKPFLRMRKKLLRKNLRNL